MNHLIINSQTKTYQIKINNNLLEIYSKKHDCDYYFLIIGKKQMHLV
jgi:hypothetical protein